MSARLCWGKHDLLASILGIFIIKFASEIIFYFIFDLLSSTLYVTFFLYFCKKTFKIKKNPKRIIPIITDFDSGLGRKSVHNAMGEM